MCPFCTTPDKPCPVSERPDGRLACACGRHSWPNAAAFLESCRRQSLTQTGMPHIYTQSY
jgi:hypothetical protein